MPDAMFEIGAPGIDVEKIVRDIRETVARKMAEGVYTDARVARAERMNLVNLRDDANFLAFYLECLRDAVFVDINDFDIVERRQSFSRALVALKRTIWKLLKFYTYRLWSQQNQVNGLLLAALEGMESANQEKLRILEARIAELESREKKANAG